MVVGRGQITITVVNDGGSVRIVGTAVTTSELDPNYTRNRLVIGEVVLILDGRYGEDNIDVLEGENEWCGYSLEIGDCYVVEENHHLYEMTEDGWIDLGRFKGEDAQNAVLLTLDNQHEDFIYNDAGSRLSDIVYSQAHLYDGCQEVTTGITWAVSLNGGSTFIASSNSTSSGTQANGRINSSGQLMITALNVQTAVVKIRAQYNGRYYYTVFTANKTKGDKYELSVNPNSIPYNAQDYATKTLTFTAKRIDATGAVTNITAGDYNSWTNISTTSGKGYLRVFVAYRLDTTNGQSPTPIYLSPSQQKTSLPVTSQICEDNTSIRIELRKYDDYDTSTTFDSNANVTNGTLVDAVNVPIIKAYNGLSVPYYFEEWFAWSDVATTENVTTSPFGNQEPYSGWSTSIPESNGLAYLWRKSVKNVFNASTRTYSQEAAQYFRMSGTNGTSINVKGCINYAYQNTSSLPQPTSSNQGKKSIVKGDNKIYTSRNPYTNTYVWENYPPVSASNGDAYTIGQGNFSGSFMNSSNLTNHLVMWSNEANDWVDLGQFKGDPGTTYYTHIAWATNVVYENGSVTSVEGFVTTKTPNDTAYIWMGVLVNTSSGQDSSNASLYKWSNTKGDDAVVVKLDPENVIITQSTEKNGNSYPLLELETRTINEQSAKVYGKALVKIAQGETEILSGFTVTISETSHCNAATYTQDGNTYVCITGVLTNDGHYYTEGYAKVSVSYNDKAYTAMFRFYTNLLGEWKQTTENGIETSIASHLGHAIDPNGNITSSEQIGTYIRGWAENTQRLTRDSVNTVTYVHNATFASVNGTTIHLNRGKYKLYLRVDKNDGETFSWSFAGQVGNNVSTSEVSVNEFQIATEGDYTFTITGSGSIAELVVSDITASVSELKQTADGFTQTVSDMNGRMASYEQTVENISMGVNSGFRNYVTNPLATDASLATVTESSIVNDEVFGNVRQIRYAENGNVQISCGFDDTHKGELLNSVVTLFVIVKPISGGNTELHFGTWSNTYHIPDVLKVNAESGVVTLVECVDGDSHIDTTKAKTGFQDLGNGWYKCWSSFNAGQVFSEVKSWCGINTINGSTWQVYYIGIIKGFGCPSVDTIRQGIGLKRTGIDIVSGLINLIADKTLFSTSSGVPMIAVQMCDANGNVGQGANYTIPSIVFYDGEIGNGGQKQWVLNYLGFIAATNAGQRFRFEAAYSTLCFEQPTGEKYEHVGASKFDDISVQDIVSRYFNSEEIKEVVYKFYSGFYVNDNGTTIYQPANGIYYQYFNAQPDTPRYWLTTEVDNNFVPSRPAASGFYYEYGDATFKIENLEWPTTDVMQDYEQPAASRSGGREPTQPDTPYQPYYPDEIIQRIFSLVYFQPSAYDSNDQELAITSNPKGVKDVIKNCFAVYYYIRYRNEKYYIKSTTGCIIANGEQMRDTNGNVIWVSDINIQDILEANGIEL